MDTFPHCILICLVFWLPLRSFEVWCRLFARFHLVVVCLRRLRSLCRFHPAARLLIPGVLVVLFGVFVLCSIGQLLLVLDRVCVCVRFVRMCVCGFLTPCGVFLFVYLRTWLCRVVDLYLAFSGVIVGVLAVSDSVAALWFSLEFCVALCWFRGSFVF